jgi:hypothetical protein
MEEATSRVATRIQITTYSNRAYADAVEATAYTSEASAFHKA